MMHWIIHILILSFIALFAFKRLRSPFKPIVFWSAMALKIIAGITLGLIFHFYYGSGDTLVFFKKAVDLSELSFSEHFYELIADGSYATNNHPRNLFFIKILSVFSRITDGSYWVSSIYLSSLSFIASWFFVITISDIFPKTKTAVATAFLFIPSIIFWSSGIMKDTISSTVLFFLVAILLKGIYLKKSSVLEIAIGGLSILVFFHIKHYLFIIFILFTGLFLSLHLLNIFQRKVKWIISLGIMVIAFGSTQYIHPYLKWDRIPQTIFETNETVSENTSNIDHALIKIDDPTWSAIAVEVPESLLIGLFKPSLFDDTILFGWIHKIENIVLLTLSILSLFLWIKDKPKVDFPLTTSAIICICLLATMLALTTPNFGSLVRYKNAFMPFMFFIVTILPIQWISSKTEE